MHAESPLRSVYRCGLLVGIIAVACFAGWWFLIREPGPSAVPVSKSANDIAPPDPRLAYDTPFRNVRPDVQYVGDAKCAPCHGDIDKSYHAHPMGHSADFVSKAKSIERYETAAHNPCSVGPYELRVEKVGDKVVHHMSAKDSTGKPLPDYVTTADIAIGSGTRGRSYLSLDHGALWQTPISWYKAESRWDRSPGFNLGLGGRRAVVPECLFCHASYVDPAPHAVNRYLQPMFKAGQVTIGCERCHGPGQIHVADRSAGIPVHGMDTSIVNPVHLSPGLRAGICAQCHLQGEERIARRGREMSDYRPGLPLEQFITIFVRHPALADLKKSVGQFEQMHLSRCFTESAGRFGCTTCHDAHAAPPKESRDQFYNTRCASCHGSGASECSEPLASRKAKSNNCVACHMPRSDSSNIIHASVTDHRVARRPALTPEHRDLTPGELPLLAFPVSDQLPSKLEQERDLGIALERAMSSVPVSDQNSRVAVGQLAEDRLQAALGTFQNDVIAWQAISEVRASRGDGVGSFEAAQKAVDLDPESEASQIELAKAAVGVGKYEMALIAAGKVIAMNPTAVNPYLMRAGIRLRLRDWREAETDCRAALAIHPLHVQARLMFAVCRYQSGDRARAEREAETAYGLTTSAEQRRGTMTWYQAQTRQ